MLAGLRRALTDPGASPEVIAAGLRQAMLAVYASQVAVVAVPAAAALVVRQPQRELGWAWWLIALALVMTVTLGSSAERAFTTKPSVRAGLQFAILLGAGCAIPAIFALILLALEGLRWGALALAFVSAQALIYASFRLLLLAQRIPPRAAEESDPQATGTSADLEPEARGVSSAASNAGTSANVRS